MEGAFLGKRARANPLLSRACFPSPPPPPPRTQRTHLASRSNGVAGHLAASRAVTALRGALWAPRGPTLRKSIPATKSDTSPATILSSFAFKKNKGIARSGCHAKLQSSLYLASQSLCSFPAFPPLFGPAFRSRGSHWNFPWTNRQRTQQRRPGEAYRGEGPEGQTGRGGGARSYPGFTRAL